MHAHPSESLLKKALKTQNEMKSIENQITSKYGVKTKESSKLEIKEGRKAKVCPERLKALFVVDRAAP